MCVLRWAWPQTIAQLSLASQTHFGSGPGLRDYAQLLASASVYLK